MQPSRELTAGEVQDRAALDAALDCVICIDDHGRVTYFNKSAQRTFGYLPAQAVGQELAVLIVPPSLRDAHRQGLARFLGSGEPTILGRRLELTAMRSDGTEFPAELTVTRLQRALEETVAAAVIWRTGEPARVDVADFDSSLAAAMLSAGLRFATGVPIAVEGELWGAITVLESTPDALPPEVVGRLESFTELVATAVANATARSELVAARRRVIEAADAARAGVTRDMHDGAQQKFVNSLINLQLAQDKWSSDPAHARELLDIGAEEADSGIEMLREVAAGLHPTILGDMGLQAALESLAARAPVPVELEVADAELAPSLQTSTYFFCSEALTNVIKHSGATSASVRVAVADGWLSIAVRDDGGGGAEIGAGGSGLLGLSDRIAALEGALSLSSPEGGAGTTLIARVPLPA